MARHKVEKLRVKKYYFTATNQLFATAWGRVERKHRERTAYD